LVSFHSFSASIVDTDFLHFPSSYIKIGCACRARGYFSHIVKKKQRLFLRQQNFKKIGQVNRQGRFMCLFKSKHQNFQNLGMLSRVLSLLLHIQPELVRFSATTPQDFVRFFQKKPMNMFFENFSYLAPPQMDLDNFLTYYQEKFKKTIRKSLKQMFQF
jgi:hypothetical protein